MIKIENTSVEGWEAAIRGMRNPMNSWGRSDSLFNAFSVEDGTLALRDVVVGDNDHDLMMRLARAGSEHAKYRRFITVTMDVTAPLYWYKEFDTYKVGTVANSCSTMHKIHAKSFDMNDFSHEHLCENAKIFLAQTVGAMNHYRERYLETKDKKYWWQMIQLLPSSYNQKRTVQLNYEVLASIYHQRRNHKLDEWVDFCKWIEALPYYELITGKE